MFIFFKNDDLIKKIKIRTTTQLLDGDNEPQLLLEKKTLVTNWFL